MDMYTFTDTNLKCQGWNKEAIPPAMPTLYPSSPVIVSSVLFHPQICFGLDNKLYGHPK